MKKNSLVKGLIQLSLIILVINYIGYQTQSSWGLKTPMRIAALSLVILSVFINAQTMATRLEFAFLVAILVSLFFSDALFGNINLLMIFLIVFAAKDMSMSEFLKAANTANVIGLAFYLALALCGMIQFNTYTLGLRTRTSLGFSNVNAASQFVLSLTFMIYLIKPSAIRTTVFIIINYLSYSITNSRTTFVAIIIYLISAFFANLSTKNEKTVVLRLAATLLVVISFLSSVLLPLLMNIYPQIDVVLSWRPAIFGNTWKLISLKQLLLGGASIEVDNSPACLVLSSGIIIALITMYLYIKRINTTIKCRNATKSAFLITMLCIGIVESVWIRAEIMLSLVMWKMIMEDTFKIRRGRQPL